jgi:hypothetical protein
MWEEVKAAHNGDQVDEQTMTGFLPSLLIHPSPKFCFLGLFLKTKQNKTKN